MSHKFEGADGLFLWHPIFQSNSLCSKVVGVRKSEAEKCGSPVELRGDDDTTGRLKSKRDPSLLISIVFPRTELKTGRVFGLRGRPVRDSGGLLGALAEVTFWVI